MDCAACHGELVPGAAFCGHCGARIEPGEGDAPAEGSEVGGVRPRRLRYAAAIAAAVVLLVGVALSWPDPGGDDEVAAGGTTSTTTRDRGSTGATAEGGVSPESTGAPILDDAAAAGATPGPGADAPVFAASSPGAGLPGGDATGGPPPDGTPGPPPTAPPAPPPTSPPGPAALLVVSDCVTRCTIPRGGRVELRVVNLGGQPGGFTVDVSDEIDCNPRQAVVGPGQTRVVELVEVSGKRRAYRVDVLDENGELIFRTSVSVG